MTSPLTARRLFVLGGGAGDPHTEAEFFDLLKMPNGTFKRTHGSRFAEIDAAISPLISRQAAKLRSVLDVGASSGITTAELADFLQAKGVVARITATDLYILAHIVDVAPGLCVLAGPDGWILQYDLFGRAIRPWIRLLDYVTLAFLPRLLARIIFRPIVRARIKRGESRRVQLVSPSLSGRNDVELIEDDILKPAPVFAGRFDLVRAANVLNRAYFSRQELTSALNNIKSYLRGPGALLLLTRTHSVTGNAGTLFELDENLQFRVVMRIGGGSEIEDLVLTMPIAAGT
jgi:chemotaxis methyl-accepting protein methylase